MYQRGRACAEKYSKLSPVRRLTTAGHSIPLIPQSSNPAFLQSHIQVAPAYRHDYQVAGTGIKVGLMRHALTPRVLFSRTR